MDAVGPSVDVALGGEIALVPALVLVDPDLLQPRNLEAAVRLNDGSASYWRRLLSRWSPVCGNEDRRSIVGQRFMDAPDLTA